MDGPSKTAGRQAEEFGQGEPLFPIGQAGRLRGEVVGETAVYREATDFCIGGINTFYYAEARPSIPATDR